METGPTKSFEDLVPKAYWEFQDVFSKKSFDQLPARKPWDHVIELTPGLTNVSKWTTRTGCLPSGEFEDDRIRPSKSPMASLVFFVKKKDSSLWFVQDYCKLNDITIKNAYSLPLIPDIMNRIVAAKAKYFTKLDIHWGYNNVRIKEADEWKAAFRTTCGLFEPLVMFFGALQIVQQPFRWWWTISSRLSLMKVL